MPGVAESALIVGLAGAAAERRAFRPQPEALQRFVEISPSFVTCAAFLGGGLLHRFPAGEETLQVFRSPAQPIEQLRVGFVLLIAKRLQRQVGRLAGVLEIHVGAFGDGGRGSLVFRRILRGAAALRLGAEGVLLGTRFMATPEAPIHPNFKQAIVESDGHDTVLTEIPDLATQRVWPGAMSRAKRNKFIEQWAGREWALRQNAAEVGKQAAAARAAGDVDYASISYGQDAGLIASIKNVKEVVQDIVAEAEEILRRRLPSLLR